MDALGALMGIGVGNRLMNDAAKKKLEQDKLMAEIDRTKRAYPTIPEQSAQLSGLNPSALEQLLKYQSKETPSETELNLANAEYARSGKFNPFSAALGLSRLNLAENAQKGLEEQRLTNQTKDLRTDVEPTAALLDRLKEFQQYSGIPLSKYDMNTNSYTDDSGDLHKVDIPGVSIPGLGRVGFYNNKAQQIDSIFKGIINKPIHEFAGSAQTKTELEQIKGEFAAGLLNTEPAMLDAMKRLEAAAQRDQLRAQSAYTQPVLDRLESGGFPLVKKEASKKQNQQNNNQNNTFSSNNEQSQAIEWAKNNPNDPRALKILNFHGVK